MESLPRSRPDLFSLEVILATIGRMGPDGYLVKLDDSDVAEYEIDKLACDKSTLVYNHTSGKQIELDPTLLATFVKYGDRKVNAPPEPDKWVYEVGGLSSRWELFQKSYLDLLGREVFDDQILQVSGVRTKRKIRKLEAWNSAKHWFEPLIVITREAFYRNANPDLPSSVPKSVQQ